MDGAYKIPQGKIKFVWKLKNIQDLFLRSNQIKSRVNAEMRAGIIISF